MNQNFQAIVENSTENSSSNIQSFVFGGALLVLNLIVMLSVGLYWMNPEMHQFISGRPLL
tara:strand:- start:634 stop:813 length:180 start_codon:yes stop_codon:yes gene_type:complete